jgi:hypothetical protein
MRHCYVISYKMYTVGLGYNDVTVIKNKFDGPLEFVITEFD